MTDLPETIPLFPLPNVVLFPGTTMPFHIFEPRYRRMVEDAAEGDGIIGMIRFAPGWETTYEENPPLLVTGCAGSISDLTPLPDGRYDIQLEGLCRFDIVEELPVDGYRTVRVAWRPEIGDREGGREAARIFELHGRLAEARGEEFSGAEPGEVLLGRVVNRVALSSRMDPEELQILLEIDDLPERAVRLGDFLAARIEAGRRAEQFRRFLPEDPRVN